VIQRLKEHCQDHFLLVNHYVKPEESLFFVITRLKYDEVHLSESKSRVIKTYQFNMKDFVIYDRGSVDIFKDYWKFKNECTKRFNASLILKVFLVK
jgi:hypothetical protein